MRKPSRVSRSIRHKPVQCFRVEILLCACMTRTQGSCKTCVPSHSPNGPFPELWAHWSFDGALVSICVADAAVPQMALAAALASLPQLLTCALREVFIPGYSVESPVLKILDALSMSLQNASTHGQMSPGNQIIFIESCWLIGLEYRLKKKKASKVECVITILLPM